eukprot:271105-Chlamydomonas_euryale.AAC.1
MSWLRCCLAVDPDDRPTAEQLLETDFFVRIAADAAEASAETEAEEAAEAAAAGEACGRGGGSRVTGSALCMARGAPGPNEAACSDAYEFARHPPWLWFARVHVGAGGGGGGGG